MIIVPTQLINCHTNELDRRLNTSLDNFSKTDLNFSKCLDTSDHAHTYARTRVSSNATSSAEDLSFGASGRNSPVHSSARVTRRGRKTDGGGKSGKEGRGENGCGHGPQARPLIASASRSHLLACGFRICCVQTRSVAAELCARLTRNRFRAASSPR